MSREKTKKKPELTEIMTFRLPVVLRLKLKELAHRKERAQTWIIRRALLEYMQRQNGSK
jgi:predicted transcriptional regulator